MGSVFIGSEAIASGELNEYQLRRWYRSIFRDVYLDKRDEPSLDDCMLGAWLWSRRRAVIAGAAASALHGARWVDPGATIELVAKSARPQRGLLVRNETLGADEVIAIKGLPVTSVARTAFDLGRHLPRGQALARLDALMRATPFSCEDVYVLGKRYRGARGLRRLSEVLPLVDGGAASPRESWLRLLLIDAGLPKPRTQVPVYDGWRAVGLLDMGWEDFLVAVEYDGDQHRTDRRQSSRTSTGWRSSPTWAGLLSESSRSIDQRTSSPASTGRSPAAATAEIDVSARFTRILPRWRRFRWNLRPNNAG